MGGCSRRMNDSGSKSCARCRRFSVHSTPSAASLTLPALRSAESMTDTEKLLRELIALPSVNLAFLPSGDPRAGEKQVSDFLAATAARAGLEVEFQFVASGRLIVLARLTPD